MVAAAANMKRAALRSQRFRPPEWRAELHTRGLHAARLRPGELADRLRAILHRGRCDCCIPDGPIPCAYMPLCAHSENPFSPTGARRAAVRDGSFRRH